MSSATIENVGLMVKSYIRSKSNKNVISYHYGRWNFSSDCGNAQADLNFLHYENTPIQIYRKFHLQKLKTFW